MVENNAAWPLIFIHQSSTSGNCLPVSECTDGRLGVCVCKGDYQMSLLFQVSSFLSLSLGMAPSELKEALCPMFYGPVLTFIQSFILSPFLNRGTEKHEPQTY